MKNKIVYIEIIAYYQGWMGHWSVNFTGTQSFEDKISHCLFCYYNQGVCIIFLPLSYFLKNIPVYYSIN